mmetsp:Transcript_37919/g.49814  ORF Transcript_37919/g.49814 Transcript_37919/m.49814 type:complete len:81 (+) Transcript_37919:47-289(+)
MEDPVKTTQLTNIELEEQLPFSVNVFNKSSEIAKSTQVFISRMTHPRPSADLENLNQTSTQDLIGGHLTTSKDKNYRTVF